MPLTPGARIGPFEIVAPFGAGGMSARTGETGSGANLSASRPLTYAATSDGVVLGTAAYMGANRPGACW